MIYQLGYFNLIAECSYKFTNNIRYLKHLFQYDINELILCEIHIKEYIVEIL